MILLGSTRKRSTLKLHLPCVLAKRQTQANPNTEI